MPVIYCDYFIIIVPANNGGGGGGLREVKVLLLESPDINYSDCATFRRASRSARKLNCVAIIIVVYIYIYVYFFPRETLTGNIKRTVGQQWVFLAFSYPFFLFNAKKSNLSEVT